MIGFANNIELRGKNKNGLRLQMKPESALLLTCAGTGSGLEKEDKIRALAGDCNDWEKLLEDAQRHHVTSLLSSNLDKFASDIVPARIMKNLNGRLRENAVHNLFLTQELLSIIRQFGEQGIQVIPFKGPTLAATAYGNVALREFIDLDILVSKANLSRAGELLTQRGYSQLEGQAGPESDHVESQLGCDYFREDGKVHIELHWSFLQKWLGFDVDLTVLWKDSPSVNIAGTKVLTLPAETLLMYLCAHGCKHRWNRLCWVVDISEVIRTQPAMDWEELLKKSKKNGSLRTLFLGLHLADVLFDAKLPLRVLEEIGKDSTVVTLAQEICASYFTAESPDASEHSDLSNDWFYLRTKERWRERRRYLSYLLKWLLLPSQKDKAWVRLPLMLGWLYIFLRPVRVLCGTLHHSEKTRDYRARP